MGVDDNPIKESKHRLRQRFEVLRKLGHGTYGKVQLAVNKDTGQEVAIKTIKKAKIENEQDLIRIRREIQIMSYVQHPHIIHIHEVFENKEKIVLVMQYASGGEMYDYLKTRKSLAETEARRIFRQIVSAVYYCHKNRICHRDLKLENILLDEKGNAKIADFGLSNIFSENNFLHTFCGSPLYASPEIVRGKPYYGPEVDCWSLGVLLYTFIYGAMPFDGSNFRALVKQISEGDYYEPKKKSDASGLIRHLLTIQPTKRATIFDICNHWWVNLGYEHSLIQVAEDMANFSPVNMDALLNMPYLKACEESKSSSMKCSNNIKLSSDNQSKVFVEKKDEKNETVSNYIFNAIERNNNLANSNSISCSDDSLMLNELESPGNGITTPNECSHSSTDKAFAFPESNMKKTVRKITENSHDINKRSKETSTISEQANTKQNKLNMADNILIRKRSNVESVFNKNLCSKNETTELCLTSKSKEETCIKNKQIKQTSDKKISISQSISNQTNKNNDSEEYSVIIKKKNFGTKNKESEESLSVQNNENEKCKKLKENECILIDKKSNNARISTNKINTEIEEYIDSNVSELKSSNDKTEVTNTDNKEIINISEEGKLSEEKIEKNIENTDVSYKKDFIQNSVEKMEAEKCQDSKTKESEENKKISVKKGPGKLIIPKFFESPQPAKGADTKKVNIPSWAVSDAKKAFENKTQEKKPLIIPTRRVSDARNKFEQKIESNAYITLPRRASKQSTILKEEINEQRRKSDTNNFPIKELPSLNNSIENADQNGEIKSNDQKNLEIGIKKTSKSENENDIKSENNNTCFENQKENSIVISENNLSLTSESLKKENCLQETIHKSVDSENCSDTQDHKFDLSSNKCNIIDNQTKSSDTKRFSNNSTIPISSPIHKVLPVITNIVTEKVDKSILPIANSEIDNTTIEKISKLNSKAEQTEETHNNILCKEQDNYINKDDKNNAKIEEAHLKNNVHVKEHNEYKNKDDKNNNKIAETLLKNNILAKESDNSKSKEFEKNNKIEETYLSNNAHTKEPDECKNKDDKNNNNTEENHKIILNKTENIEKQNNNNNNNQNTLINKENMEPDKFDEVNIQITVHDSISEHVNNEGTENHNIKLQNSIELSYNQNNNDKNIKCTEVKLISKQDSDKNLNNEHMERICDQDIQKLQLTFNLQNQNQSQFSNKEFSYIETEMEYKSKENKSVSSSKRRNSDVSLFSRSSEKHNALGLRDIHDLPESCYNDMLQFLHSKETNRSRYSSLLSKQKQIKHTLNKDHQNRIHSWLRSEQINGHSTDRDSSDNDEDFDIHFDYSYPTLVNSTTLSSLNKPENNSKSVNPTSNKYPKTIRSISQIDYNSLDEIPKDHKYTNSLSNEEIDNPIEIPNKELKFTRRNSHSTIYKDSINLNSSSLYLQNPVFKPLSSYEIQNNPQIKRISNAAEVYGTWHRKSSCHSNHKTFQQQRERFYTSSSINETHNRSNLISSGVIRDIYGTIRRPKHNYTRSISVDIPQNPTIYDKIQNYPSQEYSSINTHQENDVFNIKECRNSYLQNKYSSHVNNYNNNNNNNNPSKSDSLKMSTEDIVKNNEGTENHNIKLQNSIELSYNQNNNDKNIKCTEEKLISKQDSDKNLNNEYMERMCDQDIQKFPLQISNSSNQSHINTDKLSSLSLLEALKLKGYRNVISQQNPLFISKSKVSEENSFIENFDIKVKMNNPLEELTENKINLEIPQINHSNLQPLIETDSDVKEKLAPVCEMNELSSCRVDSDQEETVSERIWRKSFYSRFNDNRMKKRKTYREGDLKAQSLSGSNWNVLIEENLRDDFLYPRRSSLTVGNNNWSSLPRSSAKPLVKHHSYPDPVLQFSDSVGNTSKHRCSKMSRRSSSLGIVEDGLDVHKNTAYLNMLQQSHNAVSSDYNIPYSTSVGSNYNKLHGTLRPFSIYNSGNSSKEEYLSEENFKSRINSSNALSRRRFSALDNYLFTSKSPSLSDSVSSLIDYDKPEDEEVS